jgi:hypothetical protein
VQVLQLASCDIAGWRLAPVRRWRAPKPSLKSDRNLSFPGRLTPWPRPRLPDSPGSGGIEAAQGLRKLEQCDQHSGTVASWSPIASDLHHVHFGSHENFVWSNGVTYGADHLMDLEHIRLLPRWNQLDQVGASDLIDLSTAQYAPYSPAPPASNMLDRASDITLPFL